jgi:hypothetical protein
MSDREKTVTVVSGLPRSGTSMMMQMLEQGGMELLTDQVRQADENNRNGYYEFEPVKGLLKTDAGAWVGQAKGKAVKVIAQLLPHLPAENHYRIIFMQRDMQEILLSQRKMLEREGKQTPDMVQLAESYHAQLQRIEGYVAAHQHMDVLYLCYRDILIGPENTVASISEFIGRLLDRKKAASAVDSDLYRVRSQENDIVEQSDNKTILMELPI